MDLIDSFAYLMRVPKKRPTQIDMAHNECSLHELLVWGGGLLPSFSPFFTKASLALSPTMAKHT